jgi:hypothetical protein
MDVGVVFEEFGALFSGFQALYRFRVVLKIPMACLPAFYKVFDVF